MVETYQEVLMQQALDTKKRWEDIISKNLPHLCKKCWEEKFPEDFVIQYIENPIAGKYRYLYECKLCKKNRMNEKRGNVKETLESTLWNIYLQLEKAANQRRVTFQLKEMDLFNIWEKQWGKCYYTWYEMTYEHGNAKSSKLTDKAAFQVVWDRLDHDVWFSKDNVVLCCSIVAKMKGALAEEDLYKLCNDIVRNSR